MIAAIEKLKIDSILFLRKIKDSIDCPSETFKDFFASGSDPGLYIAGFIAKQTIPYTKDCFDHLLVGESEDDKYIQLITEEACSSHSQALCDYVCSSFAVLDAINSTLLKYHF